MFCEGQDPLIVETRALIGYLVEGGHIALERGEALLEKLDEGEALTSLAGQVLMDYWTRNVDGNSEG